MISYQNKNIIIIGLGITGLSCVDYFLAQDVIPKIIDTRTNPPNLDQLDKRVCYHLGDLNLDWILEADLIIVSPGIALATPELQLAANKNIEIIGDIELFCREFNQKVGKKLVAITGANGKTTVTSLVGEIIQSAGIKVGIGGNIGQPALTLLKQDCDIYVLELSSFQLETTFSLQATVATILNITEDHMSRYPHGLMQYVNAKQKIYANAKCCLINHDDPLTFPKNESSTRLSFGLTHGNYHLSEDYQYLIAKDEPVLAIQKLQLIGIHNYINALAALAISDQLLIPRKNSLTTISQFKGLPHRFERVFIHNQVEWINDSKATNVGSTEAALKSVTCQGTLFLLLGGDGKAADFSPLIPYLQKRNIALYCFGRDRHIIAKLVPDLAIITDTLDKAMQIIAKRVSAKDVVLLSPACASLDQFNNYMERGALFTQLAKKYSTGDF